MSHKTYLGHKGYSVYKDSLSLKEQVFIREELTVKPYMPKSPVQATAYPIYRESPKKFYMPRFFGVSTFGLPNEIRIGVSTPINLTFQGALRDRQAFIVEKYMNYIKEDFGGLLDIYCGFGKTVLALKILTLIGLKTLIIVHKEFLMNQWEERIQQFIPNARIGHIQGQTIDIEDKDIVIGMLQSLSMKEYPEDQFAEFGLTIVDEVHHISAEIFVRSLQKIVTRHTLGLSATMHRKDGLSKVFKMFLGEIIHKEKREQDTVVTIKAIEYKVNDEDFNTMEYDYRGNPKYSTMISKLCTFNPRTEYILHILTNELKLNAKQQIIVLAHNKNLLVYLFKAIEHRKIASVGYYIGGMKEKDLKLSEGKQIIIATYSMAAEALDIKTLTTLVLATPKTDVEQAVGRILRVKDNNPLIIDIIDQHVIFKNQWAKRRTFYHKNNYKIVQTPDYKSDKWNDVNKKSRKQIEKEISAVDLPLNKCMISTALLT